MTIVYPNTQCYKGECNKLSRGSSGRVNEKEQLEMQIEVRRQDNGLSW